MGNFRFMFSFRNNVYRVGNIMKPMTDKPYIKYWECRTELCNTTGTSRAKCPNCGRLLQPVIEGGDE